MTSTEAFNRETTEAAAMKKIIDGLTPCAGEGHGYWHCDVVGGCAVCRLLATSINDYEQFDAWSDDAYAAGDPLMFAQRRNQADRLARNAGVR
jgi:hypothetical protein